jgi:transposase
MIVPPTGVPIAPKIGCTPQLLNWVRRVERDQGLRPGPASEERERIKALERENRELRQANDILLMASTYFALAELDHRRKHDRVHRRSPRKISQRQAGSAHIVNQLG